MNIFYIATNNWAISLAEQARMKEGSASDRIFAASYKKFEQNTHTPKHPDLWWVLSEWAVTLRAHAARKMHDILFKKERKQKKVATTYSQLNHEETKDGENINLLKRRELLRSRFYEEVEEDTVAYTVDELFDMSAATIEKAHNLKKDDSQILSEWADGLSEHANYIIKATSRVHIASPASRVDPVRKKNARELFDLSYTKYSESMRLAEAAEQDRYFILIYLILLFFILFWYIFALFCFILLCYYFFSYFSFYRSDIVLSNWGLALSDHAMIMSEEETEKLFAASYAKYELAASLKPNNTLTQCNLAMTFVLHSSLYGSRGNLYPPNPLSLY